jgi:hypothetical protein
MARYKQYFQSQYPPQKVGNIFTTYIQSEGFEYVQYENEWVWKKGHGIVTTPQFIKLSQLGNGVYLLEAWLKIAILPGVYLGEVDLNGFFAAVPKGLLKNRVSSALMYMGAYAPVANNAAPPQSGVQQNAAFYNNQNANGNYRGGINNQNGIHN